MTNNLQTKEVRISLLNGERLSMSPKEFVSDVSAGRVHPAPANRPSACPPASILSSSFNNLGGVDVDVLSSDIDGSINLEVIESLEKVGHQSPSVYSTKFMRCWHMSSLRNVT